VVETQVSFSLSTAATSILRYAYCVELDWDKDKSTSFPYFPVASWRQLRCAVICVYRKSGAFVWIGGGVQNQLLKLSATEHNFSCLLVLYAWVAEHFSNWGHKCTSSKL